MRQKLTQRATFIDAIRDFFKQRNVLEVETPILCQHTVTDLHIESYERILKGEGFGIKDAFPSIDLVHNIRNTVPQGLKGEYHPLAGKPFTKHPITGK